VELKLHEFLTSGLDGGEWSGSLPLPLRRDFKGKFPSLIRKGKPMALSPFVFPHSNTKLIDGFL
jgi:hypothetical protein